jgi:hypothetical protein
MPAKYFRPEGCTGSPHAKLALGVIERDQRLDVQPRAERSIGALQEREFLSGRHAAPLV